MAKSKCDSIYELPIIAAIESMRINGRSAGYELIDDIGIDGVCEALYAMRRWYTYHRPEAARVLMGYRNSLNTGMYLDPGLVIDAYTTSSAKKLNGYVTLYSTKKEALRKKKAGEVLVQVVSSKGAKPFIAPTANSEGWFNRLYSITMVRHKVRKEIGIHAKNVKVEVV